jgi:bifunctional non-homologous end joining protein LigD
MTGGLDGVYIRGVPPAVRMPAFIPPMNATLVAEPFDDPEWLFEVKWDGFRVEAIVDGGTVRPLTRGGLDATRYFGSFLEPQTWIAAKQAIVDGEVIVVDAEGEPDFARLQAGIKGRAVDGGGSVFLYVVFDLLYVDGRSLLNEPLEERRRLLQEALRPDPRVRFSEHTDRDGVAAFAAAKERRLEGIMAKNRRSPYEPGRRTLTWQKIKIRPEQELVVGGWTTGIGAATDLAALLVGVYDDGVLRYAGKIGTGFTGAKRAELLSLLPSLATDESPFTPPPPRAVSRNARWVRPELVIRAEFASWTGDGLVRQAAYKGLDREKDPHAVRREVAR